MSHPSAAGLSAAFALLLAGPVQAARAQDAEPGPELALGQLTALHRPDAQAQARPALLQHILWFEQLRSPSRRDTMIFREYGSRDCTWVPRLAGRPRPGVLRRV